MRCFPLGSRSMGIVDSIQTSRAAPDQPACTPMPVCQQVAYINMTTLQALNMVLQRIPSPRASLPPLPPPVPVDASHLLVGMKQRRPDWMLRLEHSTLAHLNSLGRNIDNPTEIGFVSYPSSLPREPAKVSNFAPARGDQHECNRPPTMTLFAAVSAELLMLTGALSSSSPLLSDAD
jgi:hypothetical protein